MRNKYLYLYILLMFIFSFINLSYYNVNVLKQCIWYTLGICLFIIISKINLKNIFKISVFVYIILNILLLYLIIKGNDINGSRGWINLYYFKIQPSEIMKFILIIILNMIAYNYKNNYFKIILITIIPTALTYLEPDTGNVILYIIIMITVIILNNKINIKKITLCLLLFILFGIINYKFIFNFIGYNRLNRILDLFNNSSYQLNRSLINIGSSTFYGIKKIVDVPFVETDFAFTLMVSCIGMIGVILFLFVNMLFNINLLKYANKSYIYYKNIIYTFLIYKIIQETINIFMTIGLCPITGITLPFISYGGTSLICFLSFLGLINNSNCYMDNYMDTVEQD